MVESRGVAILVAQATPSAPPSPRVLPRAVIPSAFAGVTRPNPGIGRRAMPRATALTLSASMPVRKLKVQKLFARCRTEHRTDRDLPLQCGIQRQQPLLETTEKLFFKAWELACYGGFLVGRRGGAVHACAGRGTISSPAQPPASARQGLCGIFVGEIRTARGGSGEARELGPKNIHVVHLLIDAGVDSEAIHQRMKAARASKQRILPTA